MKNNYEFSKTLKFNMGAPVVQTFFMMSCRRQVDEILIIVDEKMVLQWNKNRHPDENVCLCVRKRQTYLSR